MRLLNRVMTRKRSSRFFGSVLALLVFLPILAAVNVSVESGAATTTYPWTMFHHNLNHTGYTSSRAPRIPTLMWTYLTGGMVYSSPAVVDGMVFIGSYDNNRTYALNQSTGALIWSYTLGGRVEWSSPAVAYGKVFIGSWDGRIYALNQVTGALIWSYTTGGVIRSSPALADNVVFIGSSDKQIYALNQVTGALIWSYTTGAAVYSSPAVAYGKVFIGSYDGKVYAINQATGTLAWTYTTGSQVYFSSPAVADGMVFIGTMDGRIYALNQVTGALIWSYTTGAAVYSSPAVAYGKVFIGSGDSKVYALNQLTGALVWNYTTGSPYVYGSPAVADGIVFIGSGDKVLYALNQSTGVPVWKYTTGNYVYSSPAVADGMVFVGSLDSRVYAFAPTHDVAIADMKMPDSATVGDNVTINVLVSNTGEYSETFKVAVSYDGNTIGTQAVTDLASLTSRSLTFTWNTSQVAAGNYTVSAAAGTVAGEVDTRDNTGKPFIITLAKASSTIIVSLSSVNITVGGNVAISGSISPSKAGAVTIQYRPSGGSWVTLTTVTAVDGKYGYTWTPTAVGTYEVKVAWVGDAQTLPAESPVQTIFIGKASSVLEVAVSSATVTIGGNVIISGAISPLRASISITIQYRLSGGSWSTLTSATTDASGRYAYTWTPDVVGTYDVKAGWGGDVQTGAAESGVQTVIVGKISSTVTVSASPSAVDAGGNVALEGTISPTRAGVTVTIQYRLSGGSWSTLTTVATDTAGRYTYSWKTPTTQGIYEVKVGWGGDATTQPGESTVFTVTVRAPPFPMELIIAAAAVGIVAVVLILFLKSRPKKPVVPEKPKPVGLRMSADPSEVLADGKSTSIITVELVDVDGNMVATEVDRDVALIATEGRIAGAVVIPKGKSSAKTALTSSTTIGTVAVSASSRDLRGTRVEVAFREKKRYCMHCGQRMLLEARVCPSCGNAPPSGVDVKACKNCGSVIPIVAKFCSECGASQPT